MALLWVQMTIPVDYAEDLYRPRPDKPAELPAVRRKRGAKMLSMRLFADGAV